MRPKIIFFMAMLCAVTTSCKQQAVKEPDLSNIEAIYCMPTDPGKCLPLEIVRTADGWQARYSGAPSNQTLQLKPRYEVDEYEDSTIVLDEYLQDKPNGKYVFEKYAGEVLYTYQRVSYISGSGKDTIDFMGTIVWKDFIFIDQRNFKESVKKIASHPDGGAGYGSDERDVNLTHLLHSNPESFTGSYKGIEDIDYKGSSDRQLRLYRLYSRSGGNGLGAIFNNMPLQYKTDYGIVTLNDISSYLYSRLEVFSDANFPFEDGYNVLQATLSGKTYYLIEVDYTDLQPVPHIRGDKELWLNDAIVLFAFHIDNNRLKPAKILEGKSCIEIVNYRTPDKKEVHFRYDDKTKELQVPIVRNMTQGFTGQYWKIRLGK